MSVLAMILTTAMVVPGNGPELVSGEVEESPHFDGQWVGVWRNAYGGTFNARVFVDGKTCNIEIFPKSGRQRLPSLQIIDEGGGKCRGQMVSWRKEPFLGIYEQHGDYVILAYCEAEVGRPLSHDSFGHYLLILHRVKPRR